MVSALAGVPPMPRSPYLAAAVVAGFGVAHPPAVAQAELWEGYFSRHYAGVAAGLAKRIFANAGVRTRHAVVNPLFEDPSGWPTSARMRRYLTEALPLGKGAVAAALDQSGVAPGSVGMFVVCSCTGYATPGLDILLARDLGLPADARRVFIGHMGCYAAVPGLGVAADYVALHHRPAVLLCVELASLHVQPATADPQQIVAHSLFSDAAAAVVLTPRGVDTGADAAAGLAPGALEVADVASLTDASKADHMSWHVTDLGFRMGLSPQVPDVVAQHVAPLVTGLLARHGLGVSDVAAWVVHPGGPRILDVVESSMALHETQLAASRGCLAEHGNCSSPTILMIMNEVRASGGPVVALAFGPGLTIYAALLT
jgi:predicted naringenin-chalcone synthase